MFTRQFQINIFDRARRYTQFTKHAKVLLFIHYFVINCKPNSSVVYVSDADNYEDC